MIVEVLQGLFRDADISPRPLRDLSVHLHPSFRADADKTARGKAFWDAGLAALGLKQDVCRVMVEIADEIVALNTQNRSAGIAGGSASSQQNPNGSSTPELVVPHIG